MASFRRIALAFFAIIAVCAASAAQAAPMASPVMVEEPAFVAACHCESGCDAAACADMGGCAQVCAHVAAFLAPTSRANHFSPMALPVQNGEYGANLGHTWPPPLHPPKI